MHSNSSTILIAKTWKQPKCQLTGMDKEDVVPIIMKYNLAIKKNEVMPVAATWLDLVMIKLSEVNRAEKDKYMILLTYGI